MAAGDPFECLAEAMAVQVDPAAFGLLGKGRPDPIPR